MSFCRFLTLAASAMALMVASNQGWAQAAPAPTGSLVDLVNSGTYAFNTLERLSASANQASYNVLTANPAGATYCDPALTQASATCPQATFLAFSNLRQLVQTANALLGNGGPTRYSLNLTDQALGFALRWTAAEELSAPGTAASQFTNAQKANLASRITALRYGAAGFSVAGLPVQSSDGLVASTQGRQLGGGASADDADIGIASRWGGFLNGSFGWGQRAPSVLEDAFAFDARDASLGVDYRFTRHLVAGAVGGYTNQRIDFDSSESVVGGRIRSHGYSVQLFALYEWDGPYVSASVGADRMTFDSTRKITYPSFNIAEPSVDATATGTTHSTALSATLNLGWPLHYKAFGFEPYVIADYRHIELAGFHESSVNNLTGGAAGFDFDYGAQRIASVDSALGTRFQVTFPVPFGANVTYAKAEYHHLFANDPGAVTAAYNGINDAGVGFYIPSDKPNSNFYQFAVGTSFVFKHGIQAFLQYQTSAGIDYVSSRLISGGFRGEF